MKTREYLKSLLIVVLLLGMAYLALVTWTANNPGGDLFGLFADEGAELEDGLNNPNAEAYPLSVSIKTEAGRRSAVHDDSAADQLYMQTRGVLQGAVKTAKRRNDIDEKTWRAALTTTPSVLYDYRGEIPMSILSFLMGHNDQTVFENDKVRYLCLALIDDAVYLFGKGAAEGTRFCFLTDVSETEFLNAVNVGEPNEILLAAEEDYAVNPEMLLDLKLTQVPVLSAENAAASLSDDAINNLLKGLGFNPNTVNRHVEQDGTRMFVEDISTIKIAPDGVITYHDMQTDTDYNVGLTVTSGGTSTVLEQAESARELVALLDGFTASAGRMYLQRIREGQGETEFLFGREVEGIPLDHGTDGATARVLIRENRIVEVKFALRRYTVTASPCVVLPANLAAATLQNSGEISLRYQDAGRETVEADWYREE